MKLLFGSSESPFTCTSAIGSDYSYRAWKGENDSWHEKLKIFGTPVLAPGSGFRRVIGTTRLVTLKDRDVHIWKYLEIRPKQNFASGMSQFFTLLVLLMTSFVLSQVGAYLLGEFGYTSLGWYFRYPIFGVASLFLVFFIVVIHDKFTYEYKLRRASRFIRELSSQSDSDMSYYKDVLEKIAMCNDQERSNTAKKLLNRGLV